MENKESILESRKSIDHLKLQAVIVRSLMGHLDSLITYNKLPIRMNYEVLLEHPLIQDLYEELGVTILED